MAARYSTNSRTRKEAEPPKQLDEETIQKIKHTILTRIYLASQKLNEVNLAKDLREQERILNQCKFEEKNLDQELIIIKIETALVKCQIEEVYLEYIELSGNNKLPVDNVLSIPEGE